MTTLTLPPPVIEPNRRDYTGKPARSRQVNYFITPETVTDTGTERKAVQVSVGHSTDRKEFYATANRVTLKVEQYGTSTSFWLFQGVTLGRKPVARYSAKALDAFLADTVAAFPVLVEFTPKLQALFANPDNEEQP